MGAGLQKLLRWNKRLNPDIQFQLWNDTEIDNFIRNEFPHHVYAAFRAINPQLGAAKADFFRYCIIYKRGGIYLDLKSSIKIPGVFGNIIQPDDTCILDVRRVRNIHNCVHTYTHAYMHAYMHTYYIHAHTYIHIYVIYIHTLYCYKLV